MIQLVSPIQGDVVFVGIDSLGLAQGWFVRGPSGQTGMPNALRLDPNARVGPVKFVVPASGGFGLNCSSPIRRRVLNPLWGIHRDHPIEKTGYGGVTLI